MERLIDAMSRSVVWWVGAAWRRNPPTMAQDASPAREMRDVLAELRRRWEKRFDDLSADLARWFATSAADRSDLALKAALKKGGFTVEFKTTREMNDVLQASVAENVSLIKSIPSEYFTQVEGSVMRSVQAGRDLHQLAEELHHRHGVTKRRAAIIARDQNNKATAVVTRVRYQELGITKARWLHSAGGKEPRKTHVQASKDRVIYDVNEGWFDPDPRVQQNIWPGQLINCRCVAVPVLD